MIFLYIISTIASTVVIMFGILIMIGLRAKKKEEEFRRVEKEIMSTKLFDSYLIEKNKEAVHISVGAIDFIKNRLGYDD